MYYHLKWLMCKFTLVLLQALQTRPINSSVAQTFSDCSVTIDLWNAYNSHQAGHNADKTTCQEENCVAFDEAYLLTDQRTM